LSIGTIAEDSGTGLSRTLKTRMYHTMTGLITVYHISRRRLNILLRSYWLTQTNEGDFDSVVAVWYNDYIDV